MKLNKFVVILLCYKLELIYCFHITLDISHYALFDVFRSSYSDQWLKTECWCKMQNSQESLRCKYPCLFQSICNMCNTVINYLKNLNKVGSAVLRGAECIYSTIKMIESWILNITSMWCRNSCPGLLLHLFYKDWRALHYYHCHLNLVLYGIPLFVTGPDSSQSLDKGFHFANPGFVCLVLVMKRFQWPNFTPFFQLM